jgi:hypothetical protein
MTGRSILVFSSPKSPTGWRALPAGSSTCTTNAFGCKFAISLIDKVNFGAFKKRYQMIP